MWTQADFDEIKAAYISGAMAVGHGDKRVQYDRAGLLALLRQAAAHLGIDLGPAFEFRRTRAKYNRNASGGR